MVSTDFSHRIISVSYTHLDVYKRQVLGVDDIEDETFEKVEAQPAWTQEEAEEKLEGILEDLSLIHIWSH